MRKKCVVKRRGIEEVYDQRKVYASVYSAALNCHYGEKKSEKIAAQVEKKITTWVKKGRACVDSLAIRKQIMKNLKDKDVRLMYEHHLDLS